MSLRPSLAIWIGAVGGLVGMLALTSGAFDGLLPVNRMLGAVITGLITLWALLCVIQAWEERS